MLIGAQVRTGGKLLGACVRQLGRREEGIGDRALACVVGHRRFAELPAILEVPGGGQGPRSEDVARARQVLRWGQRMWEEARQPVDAPVMTAE